MPALLINPASLINIDTAAFWGLMVLIIILVLIAIYLQSGEGDIIIQDYMENKDMNNNESMSEENSVNNEEGKKLLRVNSTDDIIDFVCNCFTEEGCKPVRTDNGVIFVKYQGIMVMVECEKSVAIVRDFQGIKVSKTNDLQLMQLYNIVNEVNHNGYAKIEVELLSEGQILIHNRMDIVFPKTSDIDSKYLFDCIDIIFQTKRYIMFKLLKEFNSSGRSQNGAPDDPIHSTSDISYN